MSGSGGGGGYDYQADAFALIASYALAQQPLDWFDEFSDIPTAISVETGGAGDDLRVELRQGGSVIEVQAKHGASKDKHFTSAMLRLASGLAKDSTLYAVLLVDGTTSSTIRADLRLDVIRLGQGRSDSLSNITRDIIQLLKHEGIDTNADLFQRLRIVVKDLDEVGQARATALTLLSQVVSESEQSSTGWSVLSKEGSRLIKNRGRRDLRSLVSLLGRHLTLSPKSQNEIVIAERYRKWVLESNQEFFVPGLNVAVPMEDSWSNLRLQGEPETTGGKDETLERQIKHYHEWERLAATRNGGSAVLANDALREYSGIIILGGPGAGKSTLGRSLAASAAEHGNLVLRVSLRQLGRLIADGVSFEKALLQIALDGSGITETQGLSILASPDFLIADGLDESDPNRILVATSLRAWVNGHPNCHVCVMTRPVGHAPSMLPGFKHLDLSPLNDVVVKEYSLKLIRAKVIDEVRTQHLWEQFTNQIIEEKKRYRFASIAARNPLLLSFLVSLFIDGKSLTGNRSKLFQQIIELIRRSPMSDRPSTVAVDSTIANRVAEALAHFLIEFPDGTVATLLDVLTKDLIKQTALSPLLAQQQVELSLRFWEEKRLIERLRSGHLEAFTFVHLNLGEYLAGRFIAGMSDDELEEWLARTRRAARWRQPILFACGAGAVNRIVSALLALDDPDDPSSTDALLAASGIAEYERAETHCINETVARLQQRLESSIPLVAIEAGIGLCEIASVAPRIVGAVATKLIDSEQEWTRLASVAASLSAGLEYISLEQTKEWLENFRLVQTWSTFVAGYCTFDQAKDVKSFPAALLDAVAFILESDHGDENVHLALRDRIIAAINADEGFESEAIYRALQSELRKFRGLNVQLTHASVERFIQKLCHNETEELVSFIRHEIGPRVKAGQGFNFVHIFNAFLSLSGIVYVTYFVDQIENFARFARNQERDLKILRESMCQTSPTDGMASFVFQMHVHALREIESWWDNIEHLPSLDPKKPINVTRIVDLEGLTNRQEAELLAARYLEDNRIPGAKVSQNLHPFDSDIIEAVRQTVSGNPRRFLEKLGGIIDNAVVSQRKKIDLAFVTPLLDDDSEGLSFAEEQENEFANPER